MIGFKIGVLMFHYLFLQIVSWWAHSPPFIREVRTKYILRAEIKYIVLLPNVKVINIMLYAQKIRGITWTSRSEIQ